MGFRRIADAERPADAVISVAAALLILRAAKIRQHIVKAPAGVTEVAPVIVVFVLATDINQAVNGARSTQYFAAWLRDTAVTARGFWFARIEPVYVWIAEAFSISERNM